MSASGTSTGSVEQRNRKVAVIASGVAGFMLVMAFAAVPLYQLFCQATGFAGTTQRASKPSDVVLDRTITVRFDANVIGLEWTFEPLQRKIDVRIGESTLAFYRATNTSSRPLVGAASFNVSPDVTGAYFAKLECFCFTEQRLEPGQTVDMPVSFFVDPAMAKDTDGAHIRYITLSYTFYPVDKPRQAGGGTPTQATTTRRGS